MEKEEKDRALNLLQNGLLPQVHGAYHDALEMAIEALQTEKKWIPVSEKLPKVYERVIVSDIVGIYIGEFVDAEENWGGKHFINEYGMHSKSAIAWMPLPEPYKEEGEDAK